MSNENQKISWVGQFGEILFLQLFLCYVIVTVGFSSGTHLVGLALPVAFVGGILLGVIGSFKFKRAIILALSSLGCWVIAILLSLVMIDPSYDGNTYHQEIVAAICRGWDVNNVQLQEAPLSLWALHYAKGIEMIAASVVSITGLLESGKSVNLVIGLSVSCLVYGFIVRKIPTITRIWRIVIAIVVLCNPVFICQSFSYYNDYAKYFYTLLTILYIIDISSISVKKHDFMMLFCVICMAIATKFNAFFEVGVVVFASLIWLFWKRQCTTGFKIIGCSIIALVIGVGLLGYHPYITNTLSAGHPLYPLLGEGAIDIMVGNTPPEFQETDRFTAFIWSMMRFSIPSVGERFGGFGFLMFPMVVISLIIIWHKRHIFHGIGLYISIWVLASCFFFEQSWWARYIPQLWIIILEGALLGAMTNGALKMWKWLTYILLACIGFNSFICLGSSIIRGLRQTVYRNAVVSVLHGRTVYISGLWESYFRQMQEKNIIAKPLKESDSTLLIFPYYGSRSNPVDYPMLHVDSVTYKELNDKVNSLPFDYSNYLSPEPDDL